MRGLQLWDFLTGELLCMPCPSATKKEKLLSDYEDRLTSYKSQCHAYRTWLDKDARVGAVLTASMEDHFAADIVGFEQTHQMWSFLHRKYESTR
jgi:hypothetical protein